eukprot:365067-Chlamydomonas_euryale.AAC.7
MAELMRPSHTPQRCFTCNARQFSTTADLHAPHNTPTMQLFKEVVTSLYDSGAHPEWAPGNYSWYCVDFAAALADMRNPDAGSRFCDVLVAGTSATESRKEEGALGVR